MCRWSIGVCCLVVAGCTRSALPSLGTPERLTLFSIDGRDTDASGDRRRGRGVPNAVGEFRGYPVLGLVEITDSDERKHLIAALKEGVAPNVQVPECFWPRHGLRVVENGRTVDYLICFQCYSFQEFVGDKKVRYEGISRDVRPAFDGPLQRAAVPIAPE